MKYVKSFTDRSGQQRWYYRRSGLHWPLPGDPAIFPDEYRDAERQFLIGGRPAQRQTLAMKRETTLKIKKLDGTIDRIVERARKRAVEKRREWSITRAWVVDKMVAQDFRCALTGLPFSPEAHGDRRNPFAPSLDRIDSAGGYTPDNVRVVLLSVNCAISDWGMEHFAMICRSFVRR